MTSNDHEHSKLEQLKHRQDRDRRIMAHKLHMQNNEEMNKNATSKQGFAENKNEKDGLDEGGVSDKIANLIKDRAQTLSSMRSRIRKSRRRAKSLARGIV